MIKRGLVFVMFTLCVSVSEVGLARTPAVYMIIILYTF